MKYVRIVERTSRDVAVRFQEASSWWDERTKQKLEQAFCHGPEQISGSYRRAEEPLYTASVLPPRAHRSQGVGQAILMYAKWLRRPPLDSEGRSQDRLRDPGLP